MKTTIIGIDCATQPKKVGLARGHFDGQVAWLDQVCIGLDTIDQIVAWLPGDLPTLLALDAPLGWPAELGQSLICHRAGEPILEKKDQLFRRETDRVVRHKIGKQSLDVGADRIARTAHWALAILHKLREQTDQAIPLAWSPLSEANLAAIEVYPAATLKAYEIEHTGYKNKDDYPARRNILNKLRNHLTLPQDLTAILENYDDALDAVICVLAGIDFLKGDIIRPEDLELARKEGWIWVRPK